MTMERRLTRQASILNTLLSVRKGMIALLLAHLWTTTLLGVDYWQPLTDPNLRAVVATEDRIVAVGDPGYVVTSTNGVDWHQCTVPTAGILTSVAYGNGKYLAVGGKGDAIHSDDGVNWHRTHLGVTNDLMSVQYLANQFVITAKGSRLGPGPRPHHIYYSRILVSSNMMDWAITEFPYETSSQERCFQAAVIYGDHYVFAGSYASLGITKDFLEWQTPPWNNIFPAHTKKFIVTPLGLLAVGHWSNCKDGYCIHHSKLALSTNITTWKWQAGNFPMERVPTGAAYGKNRFVAVGSGGTYRQNSGDVRNTGCIGTSTDGLDWTSNLLPDGQDLYDVCFFQDRFIAVGHRGLILSSSDGVEWEEIQAMRPLLPTTLKDVAFGGGRFVAVGSNTNHGATIITSTNGYWWDVRATNASHRYHAVIHGTNSWIAVGEGGVVMRSDDGTAWEQQSSPGNYRLESVAYGNGMFVATSGNSPISKVFRSPDGYNWVSENVSASNLFEITFGGGYFVAVGASNITESTDGETWVTRAMPGVGTLTQVRYANGLYLIGSQLILSYSPDRTNWTSLTNTPRPNLNSHALTHGPNGFVAAGQYNIQQSHDAIRWKIGHVIYNIYNRDIIEGAAYGAEHYVMVGTQSFFSRNLLPRARIISTENPASFRLNISTDPGLPFVVQSTESLDDPQWEDVPAIFGTNAYESFEILRQGNGSRFYRAVPRF